MSAAVVAEPESLFAEAPADVRPYEATDTDVPPIFWPKGEVPAVVIEEWFVEMARQPRGPAGSTVPNVSCGRNNTANCARLSKRRHWWRRKRLDWIDGYCILLRIETRFWEQRERIFEAQAILDHCRRAVMREMGYLVR